jgi:hypothetical protein
VVIRLSRLQRPVEERINRVARHAPLS